MASFTGVGDNVVLDVPRKDERIAVALSGTYNMTILFQKEIGSRGSGTWLTVSTFTAANATVAQNYYTTHDEERLRLIVTVDTSGTCTATLTNPDNEPFGPQFNGYRVRVEGVDGNRAPVRVTTTPLIVTKDLHAGRVISLEKADGITCTLPAATGSGDIYRFCAGTSVTSVGYVIQRQGSDVIQGALGVATDAAGVVIPSGAASTTITMNASTTGGLRGSFVECQDLIAGVWSVRGMLISTDAEATPFS